MLPKVLAICIDCNEESIKEKIDKIDYENMQIERVIWRTQGLKRTLQIILETECPYICFCEHDKISDPEKIGKMVEYLENNKEYAGAFCLGEYTDESGAVAQHASDPWMRYMEGLAFFDQFILFDLILKWEDNLLGSLENCMIRKVAYLEKAFLLDLVKIKKPQEKMLFLLEICYGMKIGIVKEKLVSCPEKPLEVGKLYNDYFWYEDLRNNIMDREGQVGYAAKELPSIYKKILEKDFDRRAIVPKVAKQITFFYTDVPEYNNLRPIGEEAIRRGYQVEFTGEIEKSVEIGVYCSHVGVLVNRGWKARFSVIMLHDLLQGELDWPNLWSYEPWDGFDIGILPGKDWSKRWKRCSGFRYAHPRLGVYELGYPKGDRIHSEGFQQHVREFREKLGLKYQYSVLYAPSWENDGKEDEFVRAVSGLPVNLLVKQPPNNDWYPEIMRNIQEMRNLHEGKYDNLYYIESDEDIFTVLDICDLVVSDESSVMAEALLFGKPSIAVADWIIPEEKPRYAKVSVDYVRKCSKGQLGECVEGMINEIKAGKKINKVDGVFSNVGRSASDIMDLIEYYIGEKPECSSLDKEIYPAHMLHGLWNA